MNFKITFIITLFFVSSVFANPDSCLEALKNKYDQDDLIDAIHTNDADEVQNILNSGAVDPGLIGEALDEALDEALYVAKEHGYYDIVRLLEQSGTNMQNMATEDDEATQMFDHIHGGIIVKDLDGLLDIDEVLIRESDELLNSDDEVLDEALLDAIDSGDVIQTRKILNFVGDEEDIKAKLNQQDIAETTLVLHVIEYGTSDMLRLLIELGAEVNAQDGYDGTALILFAIREGHVEEPEKFRVLIELGAEVNAQDYNGDTALMFASREGYFEIVDLLLKSGAEVDKTNKQGDTALMIAIRDSYDINTVRLLIEAGADVNAKNDDGDTALTIASANSSDLLRKIENSNAFDEFLETFQLYFFMRTWYAARYTPYIPHISYSEIWSILIESGIIDLKGLGEDNPSRAIMLIDWIKSFEDRPLLYIYEI